MSERERARDSQTRDRGLASTEIQRMSNVVIVILKKGATSNYEMRERKKTAHTNRKRGSQHKIDASHVHRRERDREIPEP